MPSTRAAPPAQKAKTAKPAAKPATHAPTRSAPQSAAGSPAQLLQLQRQYGNRAAQQMLQRQPAGEATIQRAVGINDQASYKQPNEALGVTSDPTRADQLPEAELREQVTQLIRHAVLASDDFKVVINDTVAAVNAAVPGGCVNGDPTFQYVTKSLQGSIDKAQGRLEGGTVAEMNDVLRGTIKCKNTAALLKAQEFLAARATQLMSLTDIKVGSTQKKDGFLRPAGAMVGYGDIKFITPIIHAAFQHPIQEGDTGTPEFWMYAEIQLMTDDMNAKKMGAGGHTFYDVVREAKEIKHDTEHPPRESTWTIKPNENTGGPATKLLSEKHKADLARGLNVRELATVRAKLAELAQGKEIEMTKREYEGLLLAGELIYRKERVAGNIERQGMGAGGGPKPPKT